MKYKYELHSHTSEVSRCASATAEELIGKASGQGYDGIVITNHYSEDTFPQAYNYSVKKKADYFIDAYNTAKKYTPEDFTVLLGAEFKLSGNSNDYLIYGITEDFLYGMPENILDFSFEDFSRLIRTAGFLLIQAHPLRHHITLMPAELLDGTEVYNYCDRGMDNKSLAEWTKENNLIGTSGSDWHGVNYELKAGIFTDVKINDNNGLVDVLKSRAYQLAL